MPIRDIRELRISQFGSGQRPGSVLGVPPPVPWLAIVYDGFAAKRKLNNCVSCARGPKISAPGQKSDLGFPRGHVTLTPHT